MNIEYIKKTLFIIAVDLKGDDEGQHSELDDLYIAVLEHLASEGNELAKEAIKGEQIMFSRWCA